MTEPRFTTPFAHLLPPLTSEEKEALRASIELEGVREPIVVDEYGQVLDGHHRLAIAPDVPYRVVAGLTEAEKIAYVYNANLTRRNLSPEQKREVAQHMKGIARALRAENPQKNSQARIAALLGVSQQTISAWLNENKEDEDEKNGRVTSAGNSSKPKSNLYEARSGQKVPRSEWPAIFSRYEEGEAGAGGTSPRDDSPR